MKNLTLIIALSSICFGAMAQVEINKATKKYEYANEEIMTVERAGAGELVNRFYYWGVDEYKSNKNKVVRDDSTFRSVEFTVTTPLPENHFGVKFVHTKRELTYRVAFDAEKKEYSYLITDIAYKCVETDRKGRETNYDGSLEEYKGAAKRGLLEELDMVYNVLADSFGTAAERDLTEAQNTEFKAWQDERKAFNADAAKNASKAKKDAAAAAKKAAKAEASAAKAAAKEAAAQAKADASAKKEADAEAAKKASESKKPAPKEGDK
jgi:hypothetical protein